MRPHRRACFLSSARSLPAKVAILIYPTEIIIYIRSSLESGAMYEGDVGKLLGHLQHRVHVAKAGGKNHVVASFADDTLGPRA